MSILIKGATVPETCFECMAIDGLHLIIEELGGHCMMAERIIDPWIFRAREGRLPNCPLVPVPTPHGPLIDEDAFIREINNRIDAAIKWGTNAIADRENEICLRAEQAVATFCEASLTARKMPTIIEAEKGE